jgi:hypothetical protein
VRVFEAVGREQSHGEPIQAEGARDRKRFAGTPRVATDCTRVRRRLGAQPHVFREWKH